MTIIKSLPIDNKEYVVLGYGAIRKNSRFLSNPEVEILLQDLITKECFTAVAGVTELDIVRIGSCWVNGQRTRLLSEFGQKKIINKVFEFNLQTNKPSTIKFEDLENLHNIIPININSASKENLPRNLSFYYRKTYQNACLNKLQTINNEEVLISSLETLTGLYTPSRKEIRRLILTKPIDDILQYFIKTSRPFDGGYFIEMQNTSLGSVPTVFLAYLSQNIHVQKIVNLIQDTLDIAQLNSNNKPYVNRYPEILPYHPNGLKFSASGIWLEKDKRFLVLRVNSILAPEEIPITIKRNIVKNQNKGRAFKKEQGETSISKIKRARETIITIDEEPGQNAGKTYIVSEIESTTSKGVITEVYESNLTENSYIQDTKSILIHQDSIIASAGEKFGNTSKVNQVENKTSQSIDQSSILSTVWKALANLATTKSSKIKSISCLTEQGIQCNSFYLINVFNVLRNTNKKMITKDNKKMLSESGGRKLLLIEVIMDDSSKRFILEIARTSKQQSYRGVCFTHNSVEKIFINKLCAHFSTDDKLSKVHKIINGETIRFNHKKGNNETWEEKMARLIETLT